MSLEGYLLQTNDSWPLLNRKTRNAIRKGEKFLEFRDGTLDELRKLHWNPSYLPLWLPKNMKVFIATLNGIPVSAVAIIEELENNQIKYKYSGNNCNFKHLQGNAYLLWKIAALYADEADFIDLGGGSQLKPGITAFKRRLGTSSYTKKKRNRTPFTRLNYRLRSWLPNTAYNIINGSPHAPFFSFLNYHETTPENFRQHLDYLKRNYHITHLDELRSHYKENKPLPKNALFITFDDGWRSNYELLPLIEEYEVPVTLFLATGYTNSYSNPKTRTVATPRLMLNEDEFLEMSKYVNIQSHGVSHTDVNMLPPEDFQNELIESKQFIEKLTGNQVYAFAYPYNRFQPKYNLLFKESGIEITRIGGRFLNTNKQNKHHIHSIGVKGNWSSNQLRYALLKAAVKTWKRSL